MNEFHHDQISTEVDWLHAKLRPLREGKAVVFTMLNEAGIGKRKNPLITIVPGESFGFLKKSVVVSVINNGSCILEIDCNHISGLVQAGVPSKYARILLDKLQLTFKEVKHGNSTKARKRSRKNTGFVWKSPRKSTVTTVKPGDIRASERVQGSSGPRENARRTGKVGGATRGK